MKVVDKPELDHAILIASGKKLPLAHVNCVANGPGRDIFVCGQHNVFRVLLIFDLTFQMNILWYFENDWID